MREIGLEHPFHFSGERTVHNERSHFEVEAERTIVEVRRADRRKLVVDQRDLLVQEAGFLGVEPYADVP
jgi:hypothetical protein